MLVQHFGQVGHNSSVQAVAILITEKGYFSKQRINKRKMELDTTSHTNLKCKNLSQSVPQKRAALGEQGNLHSQPTILDNGLSSELELEHAGGAKNDDDDGSESEREDGLMDYPFDGPTNLEGAWIPWAVKTKQNKSGRHSKYKEIKDPVSEFLYTDILSLGCAQYGCRCKVLDCIYDNFQLGESVVSGIMSHSHVQNSRARTFLLQTLCSGSLPLLLRSL